MRPISLVLLHGRGDAPCPKVRSMLNLFLRHVRLIAHRCPYYACRLVPAEQVSHAARDECCPALHDGEADFGQFIAVFAEQGATIDLRSAVPRQASERPLVA